MSMDGLYAASAGMRRSGDVHGWAVCRERRALEMFQTFPAFPPSMEVMRRSGDVHGWTGRCAPCIAGTSTIPGGRPEIAPCIPGTSTIPGGRMLRAQVTCQLPYNGAFLHIKGPLVGVTTED